MQASVRLRGPDGRSVVLFPGDTIGRSVRAALSINDPRVSEAHALVSLRCGSLNLLALRRRIAVDGSPCTEVELRPGLVVGLAQGLGLVVEALQLPQEVLAIEGTNLPRVALPPVSSLHTEPALRLLPQFQEDAACHFWWNGAGWFARLPGGEARPIGPKDRWRFGSHEVALVTLTLGGAGADPTESRGAVDLPLHILTRFDHVEIRRGDDTRIVLGGVSARIVHELATTGAPVAWSEVAASVWPRRDEVANRRSWDVALGRLRLRLREAGLPEHLVSGNGHGLYTLQLDPLDRVEDRA